MKTVTVADPLQGEYQMTLIEDLDDVRQYANILNDDVEDTLHRIVSSKVNPDRWDHMITKDEGGTVLAASLIKAEAQGTNPLFEALPLADSKIRSILKFITDGEKVLVNNVGGYCPLDKSFHTIVCERPYKQSSPKSYVIRTETKYINLENDPLVEQHTIQYLDLVDPNYSYVTNLWKFNKDQLVDIFTKFKDNGGTTVYVYTTGLDVPQMYEYSEAIIEAGIPNVEFDFNDQVTDDHQNVVDHLVDHRINVSVAEV